MARKSRKIRSVGQRTNVPSRHIWKCAVYARLSSKNNGHSDGGSIRTQVDFVSDRIAGKDDVELIGAYVDNGRTGTTFEGRVGFEQLMDEVRVGRVDCIAVKDLSRFGRNMYETGVYLERIFPVLGVRFIAVNDGLDTLDGDGGISVPFRGLVNELYAVETSRKISISKRRDIEEGRVSYRGAFYGYRVLFEERRLVPDES